MVYLTTNPRHKAVYVGRRSRGKALARPVTVDISNLCRRPDVGMLITPAAGDRTRTLEEWPCRWAADTGNYTRPVALADYLTWLTRLQPFAGRCLFATAPDVVGNWAATWAITAPALAPIRALGYRVAIVAQDGMTGLPDLALWDVLFIGGTTAWKLSEGAFGLVAEAKAAGKGSHMGRVNSWRRLCAASVSGFDSADGTCLAFNPPQYVVEIAGWLDRVRRQPHLPLWAG